MSHNPECLSCNTPLVGNFCANCGQNANTHRFNTHQIIHDIQHGIFHVDKGIFYNFSTILYPKRILEFIEGKRVRFFNPVVYLLFATAAFVLIGHKVISPEPHSEVITNPIKNEQPIQPTNETKTYKLYDLGHAIGIIERNYGKHLHAFAIFPYALASLLFFRQRKFNFWEHLYIAIFIFANFSWLSCVIFPASIYTNASLSAIYIPILLFFLLPSIFSI